MTIGPESFLNKVVIPESKDGEYEIKHINDAPGTIRPISSFRTIVFGAHDSKRIVFPDGARWHQLIYHNGVWMTDLPIEQYQCNRHVADFYGDILIGGLGIGYAANFLAGFDDVTTITVVEISPEVIRLVEPHLIDPEDKIEVIQQDLFEFLRNDPPCFDCAFYDIWQSDGEGTFHKQVHPLRELSRGCVDNVVCWNEDIMRGQLFMNLQSCFRMTQLPKTFASMPKFDLSLDKLAEVQGDMYWDWAVPFWRGWIKGDYPVDQFDERASDFVRDLCQ